VTTPHARLRLIGNQIPPLIALTVLWMLLWGEFSWLNLLVGLVVGIVVTVVFYLVPVQLSGRVHPLQASMFFVRLLQDIVLASVEVSWLAVKPGLVTRNAILEVRLRTRSDLILTWTGVATSIVPGSIVVDIDREASILYLHVLNMHSARDVERFRRRVQDTERRLVRGFGSREDVERMRGVLPEKRLATRRAARAAGTESGKGVSWCCRLWPWSRRSCSRSGRYWPCTASSSVRACSTGSSPRMCWWQRSSARSRPKWR
jgi:multicomponent Na+:H+ antiporter subunit E